MESCATRPEYASALLDRLQMPNTPNNRAQMVAWMIKEGGHAAFNPLNTTMAANGATDYNSVHVKNYPDCDAGLTAESRTMQLSFYSDIRQALSLQQPIQHLAGLKKWGTGDFSDAMLAAARLEVHA